MESKSQKELAEDWWQDISNIEAHESMRLAGYDGHDMGVNADEVLEMWIAAGSPLVETQEEITEQFCNLVNRPKIKDAETQSWDEANEIFKKSEQREPDLSNKADTLAVSAIQLGIIETYIKYKLL